MIPEHEHHLIQFAIIGAPLALIIGGLLWEAVKEVRAQRKAQCRANHPTSKGLPRK